MWSERGISRIVSVAGVIRSGRRPSVSGAASIVLLILIGGLAARVDRSCLAEQNCVRVASNAENPFDEHSEGHQSGWEGRWQFGFCTPDDPRYLGLLRNGWGNRKAEFSLFELVNEGSRLRKMHRTHLENDLFPPRTWLVGGGRFLVTIGEVPGGLETDNALVLYDFWAERRRAMKLTEFLPERVIGALPPDKVFPGKAWTKTAAGLDRNSMLFFPNTPESVREHGLPFLLVDLRDQTVALRPTSKLQDEPSTVEKFPWRVIEWDWSVCGGKYPEPEEMFPYPPMIKGVVDLDAAPKPFRAYIRSTRVLYFRWDPKSGDYILTDAEDWVPREGG